VSQRYDVSHSPVFNDGIYLLPTDNAGAIFQFAPTYKLTAFMPRTIRTIAAIGDETIFFKKRLPALAMVQEMTFSVSYSHKGRYPNTTLVRHWDKPWDEQHQWYLFAVRGSLDKFETAPYRMANVHESGLICWGGDENVPKNLRLANSIFWNTPFNKDLWDFRTTHLDNPKRKCTASHTCPGGCSDEDEYCACCNGECNCSCPHLVTKAFAKRMLNYRPKKWKPATPYIQGTQFIHTKECADAFFVTNKAATLKLLAKQGVTPIRDMSNNKIVVAFANRHKDGWELLIGKEHIILPKEKVKLCASTR
jgi:hypothetical protein